MTDETKHTPGPWGYEKTGDQLYRHVITAVHPYSDTHSLHVARQIEEEADARLIAAAPEMLDALEACQLLLVDVEAQLQTRFATLGLVNSTIAKALGRSK